MINVKGPHAPDDAHPPDDGVPAEEASRNDQERNSVAEVEGGFLDGIAVEDYPSVLRLTADPESSYRQDALDRLERWQNGDTVPHVINFEDPSDLRALLTDRRIELLRSIMRNRPASIRALAERVERDVKSVHDDLQVLAEYDVVHFEQSGRAKRPFVPYDSVQVSLEITAAPSTDDAAQA